jgi:hypothetical protein
MAFLFVDSLQTILDILNGEEQKAALPSRSEQRDALLRGPSRSRLRLGLTAPDRTHLYYCVHTLCVAPWMPFLAECS